jgi:RimJ/RimL family protein N-acetyltransferase
MSVVLSPTPVLTTARLTLRAPQAGDWPVFRDFMAGPRSSFLRDGDPPDEAKVWRSFCHIIGMWVARGYGAFVLTEHGKDAALGLVGPWNPIESPEPEIAWSIWAAEAEGKGYAFEAGIATRDHAFRDLGWTTAVSYIDYGNTRSMVLAERMGAVRDDAALRAPGDDCLVYRHPSPPRAA